MPYNPFQRLIKTYKRFLVLFEKGLQQKDQEGGRGEGGAKYGPSVPEGNRARNSVPVERA